MMNVFLNQHSQERETTASQALVISQSEMTPSALGCKLQHAHTLKLQLQPPWGGYAKSFHSRQKSQNPTNRRFVLVILSQIFWVFMDSEIKNTPMGRKHPGLRSKP